MSISKESESLSLASPATLKSTRSGIYLEDFASLQQVSV